MAKDTFYFSHDYNARSDEKIKLLIRKHGMIGYGVFWSIIEDLYNNANALRLDIEGIAFDLRVDENMIKSIINDSDLFVINDGYFGSQSVERRLNERNLKSKKASISASYRWKKNENDANAMRTQCDGNAKKERKVKKMKYIKRKKIKYAKLLLSQIKISDFENINPDYYEIAVSFQNLFRENLKQSGASTKTVDRMKGGAIDDIRLTIESDGYTVEDLRQVYKFLQVDDFWKTNILSISKLRKQMAQLKLKMSNNGKTKRDYKEGTTFEELAAVIQSKFPAQN